jgi:hypothetical protein
MGKPRLAVACFLICGLLLSPASAAPSSPLTSELAQSRQCRQQQGPFATQDTAWQRWRQARAQGYAVSDGIFPCWDGYGGRGHCFNVFVPC